MYVGWAIVAAQIAYCRYLLLAVSWNELGNLGISIAQGVKKDLLLLIFIALASWLVSRIPGRWNRPFVASSVFIILSAVSMALLFSDVVFVRFFQRTLDLLSVQHAEALWDFKGAVFELSGTVDLLLALVLPLVGCIWFSKPSPAGPRTWFFTVRFAFGVLLVWPNLFNLIIVRTGGDFTEQNEVAALGNEVVDQIKSGHWGGGTFRYDPAAIFTLHLPADRKPAAVVKIARQVLLPASRAPASDSTEQLSLQQHTKFDIELSRDPALRRLEREIRRRIESVGRRPNIVNIVVESLRTHEVIDPRLGPLIFPFLTQLRHRSLYFSRFLTYGVPPNQSAQGHFAVNCGVIPPFFSETISLSNPNLSIRCLPDFMAQHGYNTIYIQGHYKGYQNEFRFYHGHGVKYFFDGSTFPANAMRIGSGVLDGEIFKLANSVYREPGRQPFYSELQTLTMHVPWGDDAVLPRLPPELDARVESDSQRQWLRREMYFDRELQRFFAASEKEDYFANTIFVITGDHGLPNFMKGRNPLQVNLQRNWSPLYVYSPPLIPPGEVGTLKTQLDIPVGFLQLLGLEVDHNFISSGLFPLDRPTQFLAFMGPRSLLYTDPQTGDYCNADGSNGQCLRVNAIPPAMRDRVAFALAGEFSPYVIPDSTRPLQEAYKLWLMDYLYRHELLYPRQPPLHDSAGIFPPRRQGNPGETGSTAAIHPRKGAEQPNPARRR